MEVASRSSRRASSSGSGGSATAPARSSRPLGEISGLICFDLSRWLTELSIHSPCKSLLLARWICGREARECGQARWATRVQRVVRGLSTRPEGRAPARRTRGRGGTPSFSAVATAAKVSFRKSMQKRAGNLQKEPILGLCFPTKTGTVGDGIARSSACPPQNPSCKVLRALPRSTGRCRWPWDCQSAISARC